MLASLTIWSKKSNVYPLGLFVEEALSLSKILAGKFTKHKKLLSTNAKMAKDGVFSCWTQSDL